MHASFRVQIASDESNVKYCSKTDDITHVGGPWEFGERSKQGERSDLKKACDTLKETRSYKRVAEEHPETFMRYYRGFREWLNTTDTRVRDWKTKLIVIYGEPRTGKSSMAREIAPGAYYLGSSNSDTVWWDGYEDQETVVIDDFYSWIRYDTLLRLTDRYPMQVDVKGGKRNFLAKTIIITSNQDPKDWYQGVREKNKYGTTTLMERIDECWYFVAGLAPEKIK